VRRLFLALLPFVAADAGAQIIRPGPLRFGEPAAWASFGASLLQPWSVRDGTTGSVWQFGNATQFSVGLEKELSGGAALGLRGATARAPLRYTGSTAAGAPIASDADANVSQLVATLHVASGRGLHSVLELSAGATLYSNFRARDTNERLQPTSSDADFTFVFGYGLGYAFSPVFSLDVVQDLTTVLHQKTGLGAGDDSSARINGTRLVARLGLGSR
jgi:hypothetical protein